MAHKPALSHYLREKSVGVISGDLGGHKSHAVSAVAIHSVEADIVTLPIYVWFLIVYRSILEIKPI